MGSIAPLHCMQTATEILQAVNDAPGDAALHLFRAGVGLSLAAWEEIPLNNEAAGTVLRLDETHPCLNPVLRTMLRALNDRVRRPGDLRYLNRLIERNEMEKARGYISGQCARDPRNPFWIQRGAALATYYGGLDWALELLETLEDDAIRWSTRTLRGNLLLALGRHEEASEAYAEAEGSLGDEGGIRPTLALERRGEALLRMGETEAALRTWRQVLAVRPWHTNLLLRVHDVISPSESGPVDARTAVLVYSYNKAEDLDLTLKSLTEDDGDWSRIFALNNGSTDMTGDVLDKWSAILGERMRRVDLPVNIGAPAARNWLMHLPEVREHDFTCYLDDDVSLPGDWLRGLHDARRAYPDASVWGCRVLDFATPHVAQSVDLHLQFTGGPAEYDLTRTDADPFNVTDFHTHVMDAGQFTYMRPCISVTGCCHLFRTEELLSGGDFLIHLSPSQFDDLERDLRMASRGEYAVYNGHTAILHRKSTGRNIAMKPAAYANAQANRYKMIFRYPAETVRRIIDIQTARLWEDLQAKLATVETVMNSMD